MAQIQITVFLLYVASIYAASIRSISSDEMTEDLQIGSDEQIMDYDPFSTDVADSGQSLPLNGFEIGKIIVEAMMSVLQIVKQLNITEQGMKSIALIVARILSVFIGRYYETFQKLMPLISSIAATVIKSLR